MVRPRGKQPMKKIEDDKTRKATFKRRKTTICNKLKEINTLCDGKTCMIHIGHGGEVTTWPEQKSEVETFVREYNSINEKEKMKSLPKVVSQVHDVNLTCDERYGALTLESLMNVESSLHSKLHTMLSDLEFVQWRINQYLNNCRTSTSTGAAHGWVAVAHYPPGPPTAHPHQAPILEAVRPIQMLSPPFQPRLPQSGYGFRPY